MLPEPRGSLSLSKVHCPFLQPSRVLCTPFTPIPTVLQPMDSRAVPVLILLHLVPVPFFKINQGDGRSLEENEEWNWEEDLMVLSGNRERAELFSNTRHEMLGQASKFRASSFPFSVFPLHLRLPPCSHTHVSFAQLSILAPL